MVVEKTKCAQQKPERTMKTSQTDYNTLLKKLKSDSQNLKILRHLLKFGSITQRQAAMEFGCWRLPARIHELREYGVPIETILIPTKSECASSSYAKYTLEDADEV